MRNVSIAGIISGTVVTLVLDFVVGIVLMLVLGVAPSLWLNTIQSGVHPSQPQHQAQGAVTSMNPEAQR